MTTYLLGIDAGTSVIKAAVFTLAGEERGSVGRETPVISLHPGWAETDMDALWDAARDVIPRALASAGVHADEIAAIGVTGQMVGAWLIDDTGKPVRPAILWSDGRSQGLIDRLSIEHPGFLSAIFESSGSAMQQGCTLPVLRWLLEHEPKAISRARHLLCCKDWLVYNLTGTIQLDPAEVSVMPGSTRNRDLSEAMIDLFGLRALRPLFPMTKPADSVAGGLLPEVADALGLRAGIPVAVGTGDVLATAIGAGVVTPGTAVSLLGTNYLNCLVTAEPIFEPRDVGVMFCPPAGGWLRAMLNVSGTTSLDWLIDQFFAAERATAPSDAALFAELERLAEASGLGARGVIYLPYLSAQGITAPVYEPNARAEFYGLSLEHTRADMLRAVYEGLALSIRDGYGCIPAQIDEIRLTGGMARSDFFCQLVADVTGKRVTRPQASEFGARGAALLAAVGIGAYASIGEAVERTPLPAQTFTPDPAHAALYDGIFDRYVAVRTALMGVWRR